jgi:nitrate reductase gamma subunit
MYEFVTGPLVWISFIIFFIGMIVKTVSLIRLAKEKDKVVFDHLDAGWSIRSIVFWLIPFGSRSMREKPVLTAFSFTFHICLLATPIFLLAHNTLWDERWGFSWWSLSETAADTMTVIFLVAAIGLVIRRVTQPEVRIITTAYDFLLMLIAAAPFITGFLAYHQWGPYKAMLIIHILCGEIMLIAIPLTKLSHMILFFLTRAHIGSEMGQRREAKTW